MSILLQTTLDLAIWETFIRTWSVYLSTYIQLPSWHLFLDVCHLKLNVIWSSPPGPKLVSSTVFLISENGWHLSLSNCSGIKPCRHHWPCLSHTCFMKALYKIAPYLHLLLSPSLTLLQLHWPICWYSTMLSEIRDRQILHDITDTWNLRNTIN